jgi:transposase
MLTVEEKAKIIKFVYECGSIIQAQRRFYREMKKKAPERHSILRWVRQFEKSGAILKSKSSGRPKMNQEKINEVR